MSVYALITTDDLMMMSLPPCCRGGGCMNMSSNLSSTMYSSTGVQSPINLAADSIGLSRQTQAVVKARLHRVYGPSSAKAIFATLIAHLCKEPLAQRKADVATLNQEYLSA